MLNSGQVLYDSLIERGVLDYYFMYEKNQYMAGIALAYSFFGEDFCWTEENGPDEVEPILCDHPVLTSSPP